jgi:hypothetical protein
LASIGLYFWLVFFPFFSFQIFWVIDSFANLSNISFLAVIPVVSYPNADTFKEAILKENNKKSGVYR